MDSKCVLVLLLLGSAFTNSALASESDSSPGSASTASEIPVLDPAKTANGDLEERVSAKAGPVDLNGAGAYTSFPTWVFGSTTLYVRNNGDSALRFKFQAGVSNDEVKSVPSGWTYYYNRNFGGFPVTVTNLNGVPCTVWTV
mmetsp:Transcript_30492/g.49328  ORF Transcript_30492/g.49328 Transcript_30492/m.49328 type:complete len:142 (+) Transcript_30492:313-738(+)|eukprot:CAMPEP_0184644276 /NCGR_PEP_ID=MMETSP0308-20130426/1028_1 /TAXON_ID=38269 /ORGANISM="Gloeochaete witrockiana, Strain SAG 46.84" /LENGTH=141 /DNA_ID=CAMNT_0027072725 /DNA_START=290 /DNA_END=715 /DNA_ORIENTATION=-